MSLTSSNIFYKILSVCLRIRLKIFTQFENIFLQLLKIGRGSLLKVSNKKTASTQLTVLVA